MKMFYFRLRELRNDADGQTIEFQEINPNGKVGEPLIETFEDPLPDMGMVALVAFQIIGGGKVLRLLSLKGEAYCQVCFPDRETKPRKYDELLSKNVFTAN